MDKQRLIPLIVATALFMENMDSTVIATSLPAIAADIGTSPLTLKLAVTSYLLSLAVFIPVSGWTADRFGARTVFRGAIAVFMLGSIGCALSGSLSEFVVARIVEGMGGAMMTPVARLILVRSVDRRELINAMVWVTLPALIGPLIGPALGGFITTFISWPWIFLINIPIGPDHAVERRRRHGHEDGDPVHSPPLRIPSGAGGECADQRSAGRGLCDLHAGRVIRVDRRRADRRRLLSFARIHQSQYHRLCRRRQSPHEPRHLAGRGRPASLDFGRRRHRRAGGRSDAVGARTRHHHGRRLSARLSHHCRDRRLRLLRFRTDAGGCRRGTGPPQRRTRGEPDRGHRSTTGMKDRRWCGGFER